MASARWHSRYPSTSPHAVQDLSLSIQHSSNLKATSVAYFCFIRGPHKWWLFIASQTSLSLDKSNFNTREISRDHLLRRTVATALVIYFLPVFADPAQVCELRCFTDNCTGTDLSVQRAGFPLVQELVSQQWLPDPAWYHDEVHSGL